MLKIVTIPNSILTKKTALIKSVDRSLIKLADDMIETCRSSHGIGLAATQIGKSIRFCVINLEHLGLPSFALVNPKIVRKSWKKTEMEEGCLSVPGIFGIVKRSQKISVVAQDLKGEKHRFSADGMLARVIQHEVDHLDGILFISKIIKMTSGKSEKSM